MGKQWGTNKRPQSRSSIGATAMLTVKQLESEIKRAVRNNLIIKISDTDRRGQGSLQIRISEKGQVRFYYRHVKSDGKRDDYPLGNYDPAGSKGYTLEKARDRYGELAAIYRAGSKNIREHLKAMENAEVTAQQIEVERIEQIEAGSLRDLLSAYVSFLKTKGKPSAKDVENFLKNHVLTLGDLADRRANELGPRDLRTIFDRLQQLGLTRVLGKTRAALHSAYNLGVKSEFDSTIPVVFRLFKVETNPVAALPTFSALSKPGERVLSHSELKDLLNKLTIINTMAAKTMLTAIYLGGQRPTQLVRVTAADVDIERGIITLRDGKGKRAHPRLHALPMGTQVRRIIQELLLVNADAASLFSSDCKTIPHSTTLSKLVHGISLGAYRLGDIRRTCETELAALGVSKDLRAQILSHELGGIQAKHYDRHHYLDEKTNALRLWNDFLLKLINNDNLCG
jgi:integrase